MSSILTHLVATFVSSYNVWQISSGSRDQFLHNKFLHLSVNAFLWQFHFAGLRTIRLFIKLSIIDDV